MVTPRTLRRLRFSQGVLFGGHHHERVSTGRYRSWRTTFHLHGQDKPGRELFRKKRSRRQLMRFFASLHGGDESLCWNALCRSLARGDGASSRSGSLSTCTRGLSPRRAIGSFEDGVYRALTRETDRPDDPLQPSGNAARSRRSNPSTASPDSFR